MRVRKAKGCMRSCIGAVVPASDVSAPQSRRMFRTGWMSVLYCGNPLLHVCASCQNGKLTLPSDFLNIFREISRSLNTIGCFLKLSMKCHIIYDNQLFAENSAHPIINYFITFSFISIYACVCMLLQACVYEFVGVDKQVVSHTRVLQAHQPRRRLNTYAFTCTHTATELTAVSVAFCLLTHVDSYYLLLESSCVNHSSATSYRRASVDTRHSHVTLHILCQ